MLLVPGTVTLMQAKTVFFAAAPRGVPAGAVFRKVGAPLLSQPASARALVDVDFDVEVVVVDVDVDVVDVDVVPPQAARVNDATSTVLRTPSNRNTSAILQNPLAAASRYLCSDILLNIAHNVQ